MPFAVRKAHDLVLNRRTVARPLAHYLAAIQRRTADVFPDDSVSLLICPGHIAVKPRTVHTIVVKAEREHFLIAGLDFQLVKVKRRTPDSGRSACLQPSHIKTEAAQAVAQSESRFFSKASAGSVPLPDENASVHERACSQDNCP